MGEEGLEKTIIARVAPENNSMSEKKLLVIFTKFGVSVCPLSSVNNHSAFILASIYSLVSNG